MKRKRLVYSLQWRTTGDKTWRVTKVKLQRRYIVNGTRVTPIKRAPMSAAQIAAALKRIPGTVRLRKARA